jgi:hypothetical protein
MPRKSDGQQRTLDFIKKYLAKHGEGPKIGVIAAALKEPNRNISRWVKKLAAAGRVNLRSRDYGSLRIGSGGGGKPRRVRADIGDTIERLLTKRSEIDAAIRALRNLEDA